MKTVFYAGSFDPFTNGHLHIVKLACEIFDKVYIGIGINASKKPRYDKTSMKSAINNVLEAEKLNNAECIIFENLAIDTAKSLNCDFMVRGLRNGVDYDYEENLAQLNKELSGIETIYIRAGKNGIISSSMVYELLINKRDISPYVPAQIINLIK